MAKAIIDSPIGAIIIEVDDERLCSVRITGSTSCAKAAPTDSIASKAAAEIRAYFGGELKVFDLPLTPAASDRGQALREAISAIPFGDTLSYGALARLACSGARAIGQACSRNPFPLIVPCHRVLASGGQLGHYSAGNGLATKSWLLDHENGGRLI